MSLVINPRSILLMSVQRLMEKFLLTKQPQNRRIKKFVQTLIYCFILNMT
jgi:hypothetical protein